MSGRFSVPDEERVSERKARIYSALNKSAVSGTWILCSFSASFTPLCSVCRLGSFFLCSFNSVVIPLRGPALSTRNDIYIVPLKNACVDYIQRLFTRIIWWRHVSRPRDTISVDTKFYASYFRYPVSDQIFLCWTREEKLYKVNSRVLPVINATYREKEVAFLNFSAASDLINYDLLIAKLNCYLVSTALLLWIKAEFVTLTDVPQMSVSVLCWQSLCVLN